MFGKYFLVICAFALFAVVLNVQAAEVPPKPVENENDDEDAESRSIADVVISYLEDAIVGASKKCLKEAANSCRKVFWNPKKLVKCGKEYFKENKGECAVPEFD